MVSIMEEYLEDYNQVNTAVMRLVLFEDATKHVCRISRVIRQPLGNALLLGVGGSGRQSLTRLAAHMWVLLFFYSDIHWASKETDHFFRVTLTKIHNIKINNIWTQISFNTP